VTEVTETLPAWNRWAGQQKKQGEAPQFEEEERKVMHQSEAGTTHFRFQQEQFWRLGLNEAKCQELLPEPHHCCIINIKQRT